MGNENKSPLSENENQSKEVQDTQEDFSGLTTANVPAVDIEAARTSKVINGADPITSEMKKDVLAKEVGEKKVVRPKVTQGEIPQEEAIAAIRENRILKKRIKELERQLKA